MGFWQMARSETARESDIPVLDRNIGLEKAKT